MLKIIKTFWLTFNLFIMDLENPCLINGITEKLDFKTCKYLSKKNQNMKTATRGLTVKPSYRFQQKISENITSDYCANSYQPKTSNM